MMNGVYYSMYNTKVINFETVIPFSISEKSFRWRNGYQWLLENYTQWSRKDEYDKGGHTSSTDPRFMINMFSL